MDCRVNLMKKKSVRLVLVGMCGAAGLLVTPAMRAESGLGESVVTMSADEAETGIIRKSKFPQNPKRSVRFSGKKTKRSVQKRKARNTQKAETKVL